MIKKLVSHLGEYKRAAILTPIFSALEAVMDVLLRETLLRRIP